MMRYARKSRDYLEDKLAVKKRDTLDAFHASETSLTT